MEHDSIEAQERVADIDGVLAGDAEAGIEGVVAAVGAADDAGGVEHGEVLGDAGRGGAEAAGDLANRQGLPLESSRWMRQRRSLPMAERTPPSGSRGGGCGPAESGEESVMKLRPKVAEFPSNMTR